MPLRPPRLLLLPSHLLPLPPWLPVLPPTLLCSPLPSLCCPAGSHERDSRSKSRSPRRSRSRSAGRAGGGAEWRVSLTASCGAAMQPAGGQLCSPLAAACVPRSRLRSPPPRLPRPCAGAQEKLDRLFEKGYLRKSEIDQVLLDDIESERLARSISWAHSFFREARSVF